MARPIPKPLALAASATALAALALLALAVALASAEPTDLYMLEEISSAHSATSVAVRADGLETIVLESKYDNVSRLYDNDLMRLVDTTLSSVRSWSDVNWKWTFAAFDPSSTEGLLGGTNGVLMSYDGGSLSAVSGLQSYMTVTCVDWHPTEGYAFVGTSYGYIYKYDGRLTQTNNVGNSVSDVDFAPNGSEAAFAAYYQMYIVNLTTNSWRSYANLELEDGYYYYCYAVEYDRSSRYLYSQWYDLRGGNAILRLRGELWEEFANINGQVNRMVFETEGSFLFCALTDGMYTVTGNFAVPLEGWGITTGKGGCPDVAIDDHTFTFLFGNDDGIWKDRQKPDIKPWLLEDVEDATCNEDDATSGHHLVDMLDYVTDDRFAWKLRFEVDVPQPTPALEVRPDGQFLTVVQKEPNWNGKLSIRVKVWDRGYDNIVGSTDDNWNHTNFFTITVKPVNDPIRMLRVDDKVVGEDVMVFFVDEAQYLNLTLDFEDVDLDTPGWSFNRSLPSMKVLAPGPGVGAWTLSFLPRNRDVGTIYILLSVADGMGSTDRVALAFHVRNVNNPPRLLGVTDRTVHEDSWLNMTISAVDEDIEIGIGDVLQFSTNRTDDANSDDLPNFGLYVDALDPTRIHVYFLPTNEDVGAVLVEFRVRDGLGPFGTWDDTRTMAITVVNTNDAPVFATIGGVDVVDLVVLDLEATEDVELLVDLVAHDDDGDPLTFYVDDVRFRLVTGAGDGTAQLRFLPTNDDVGPNFVDLSVWDDHNSFGSILLNASVTNVNDVPVIVTFEARAGAGQSRLDFTLWEDQAFTAPVVVLDVDSGGLTFSDTSGIFTIETDAADPHRATLRWTPGQADVGLHVTTVMVDDRDGGRASITVGLDVMDVNDPPSVPTITQLAFESPVSFQITPAADPEGDTLTYIWDYGDFTPVESGTDLVRPTHTYTRWGTFHLTLTVSDGRGGESAASLDVLVQQTGEEEKPVKVEKGPVGLILLLTLLSLVAAAVMVYLYLTTPQRGAGGGA